MANLKHRVIAVIGGKSYDLRPSGNPHADLPKPVLAYLKEGGHLADEQPVPSKAGDAKLQGEIDRLTAALADANSAKSTLTTDLEKANADHAAVSDELVKVKAALADADGDLEKAKAEIVKLTPKA